MARHRKKSYKDLVYKIQDLAELSAELGVNVSLGNVEFYSTSIDVQEAVIERLMSLMNTVEVRIVENLLLNPNHYKQKRFIKWQECYTTMQNYRRDYFNSL